MSPYVSAEALVADFDRTSRTPKNSKFSKHSSRSAVVIEKTIKHPQIIDQCPQMVAATEVKKQNKEANDTQTLANKELVGKFQEGATARSFRFPQVPSASASATPRWHFASSPLLDAGSPSCLRSSGNFRCIKFHRRFRETDVRLDLALEFESGRERERVLRETFTDVASGSRLPGPCRCGDISISQLKADPVRWERFGRPIGFPLGKKGVFSFDHKLVQRLIGIGIRNLQRPICLVNFQH